MSENNIKKCSICGENNSQMIRGKGGYICFTCVEKCAEKIGSIQDMVAPIAKPSGFEFKIETPIVMKDMMDEYVIGQDIFKERLVTAVYNHYKNVTMKSLGLCPIEIDKSNIMLIGPTGSGKTYTLKTLAKKLGLPIVIGDANTITSSGYVGNDPETLLKQLYDAADGDIEKAQTGIIFIDEIDKIGRKGENPSLTKDVSGEGVQQALLKIVEGCITTFPEGGGRKNPHGNNIEINTENILFIVGGSFEGIEKIVAKRLQGKSQVGFGGNAVKKEEVKFNDYVHKIIPDDLKKFGMLPEFLGRFPILTTLEELSEEAMISILTQPKNALIKQYKELFLMDGVEANFEHDALIAIAKLAVKNKTGARGLRSILEKTLYKAMFLLPGSDVRAFTVTEDDVNNPESFNEYIAQLVVDQAKDIVE